MSKIKLEVGKTYRNRKGKEVKIIEKDGGRIIRYPYKGSNDEWYSSDGRFDYVAGKSFRDLIEEVAELPEPRYTFITPDDMKEVTAIRYTFDIPDGMKKGTVSQEGNRIIVEMVPEDVETPKAGDVMISDWGGVYILKEVKSDDTHIYFVMLGKNGHLFYGSMCTPGRPATPEEAQPLWDALKKAGKRWNAETMKVEDVPESTRIREWVEEHLNDGHYNQEGIAEVIGHYLKHREGEK